MSNSDSNTPSPIAAFSAIVEQHEAEIEAIESGIDLAVPERASEPSEASLRAIDDEASAVESYEEYAAQQSLESTVRDAYAGADQQAAEARAANPLSHPWLQFQEPERDDMSAPEFVMDDVITAGMTVMAGSRGLGKSSLMGVMAAAITGHTHDDYPLKASVKRKVIYLTEDLPQLRRIIKAAREDGVITGSPESLSDMLKLVETKRLAPEMIIGAAEVVQSMTHPNVRVDGSIYHAPPVLIIDTAAASLELDNSSDNNEVSRAIATIRQAFSSVNIILIGHIAKASRQEAKDPTFLGAQAFEADTQQTIYLVDDAGLKLMVMGKRRFEPVAEEFEIGGNTAEFTATDVLGREVKTRVWYSIPTPFADGETRAEKKDEMSLEAKQRDAYELQARILKQVEGNPGIAKSAIESHIRGRAADIRQQTSVLLESNKIHIKTAPSGNGKMVFAGPAPRQVEVKLEDPAF